jgi:hypothetical protein
MRNTAMNRSGPMTPNTVGGGSGRARSRVVSLLSVICVASLGVGGTTRLNPAEVVVVIAREEAL